MESSHCSCKVKNGLEKDEDGYGKIHSGRLLKQNNNEGNNEGLIQNDGNENREEDALAYCKFVH